MRPPHETRQTSHATASAWQVANHVFSIIVIHFHYFFLFRFCVHLFWSCISDITRQDKKTIRRWHRKAIQKYVEDGLPAPAVLSATVLRAPLQLKYGRYSAGQFSLVIDVLKLLKVFFVLSYNFFPSDPPRLKFELWILHENVKNVYFLFLKILSFSRVIRHSIHSLKCSSQS